jgi:glycerol kinase
MDISTLSWDPTLLERFSLVRDMLPDIRSNAEVYGRVAEGPLAGVPISGAERTPLLTRMARSVVGARVFQSAALKWQLLVMLLAQASQ